MIFISFRCGVGLILHAKGPTHKRIASDCLEEIIREHFHFHYGKSDENHTMLFTVMVTHDLASPAFEIQERIIKKVHNLAKWYQVEIISKGSRYEFESFQKCQGNQCQKRFIIDFKSNFYVIVIDDGVDFDEVLEVVEESNTFNPMAMYLVYVEYEGPKYKEVAKQILLMMWKRLLIRTAVLIPKSLQAFNLYKMNSSTKGPYACASNITLSEVDQCVKGAMVNVKQRYFQLHNSRKLNNCSMGVISMPYEPFVINKTDGFEIEVLQSIGKIIDVHFNITVSLNLTDSWGTEDENGNWSGKLKLVMAIISIILASAYTCSLVYYLKNPIREHQPTVNSDIMDSFEQYKYGIGGISRYRELFTFSSEDEGTELYEMYQIANGDNDTVMYWINKVAEDRDIWTISSKLFANYLLAHDSNVTTDEDGKPKIYVFKKPLMSYSISLIMRKGHPLLWHVNYAIQRLKWGGLIARISRKYTQAIDKKKSVLNEDDDTYKPLVIDDLQGAFALLFFGYGLGLVALLVECLIHKYKSSKPQQKKAEAAGKRRRFKQRN
ncbi:hypothetical protein NQ315_004515 [Exocentrus adspersus]|uniref:Ionotropic receptor n=1 Tax=Exocentrus adspersus TaxID=1586481 RepID=A0AAV8VPK7_9CUCU|nr:hypothetical protein NQ315_004515 [Exocentrus adspersus]